MKKSLKSFLSPRMQNGPSHKSPTSPALPYVGKPLSSLGKESSLPRFPSPTGVPPVATALPLGQATKERSPLDQEGHKGDFPKVDVPKIPTLKPLSMTSAGGSQGLSSVYAQAQQQSVHPYQHALTYKNHLLYTPGVSQEETGEEKEPVPFQALHHQTFGLHFGSQAQAQQTARSHFQGDKVQGHLLSGTVLSLGAHQGERSAKYFPVPLKKQWLSQMRTILSAPESTPGQVRSAQAILDSSGQEDEKGQDYSTLVGPFHQEMGSLLGEHGYHGVKLQSPTGTDHILYKTSGLLPYGEEKGREGSVFHDRADTLQDALQTQEGESLDPRLEGVMREHLSAQTDHLPSDHLERKRASRTLSSPLGSASYPAVAQRHPEAYASAQRVLQEKAEQQRELASRVPSPEDYGEPPLLEHSLTPREETWREGSPSQEEKGEEKGHVQHLKDYHQSLEEGLDSSFLPQEELHPVAQTYLHHILSGEGQRGDISSDDRHRLAQLQEMTQSGVPLKRESLPHDMIPYLHQAHQKMESARQEIADDLRQRGEDPDHSSLSSTTSVGAPRRGTLSSYLHQELGSPTTLSSGRSLLSPEATEGEMEVRGNHPYVPTLHSSLKRAGFSHIDDAIQTASTLGDPYGQQFFFHSGDGLSTRHTEGEHGHAVIAYPTLSGAQKQKDATHEHSVPGRIRGHLLNLIPTEGKLGAQESLDLQNHLGRVLPQIQQEIETKKQNGWAASSLRDLEKRRDNLAHVHGLLTQDQLSGQSGSRHFGNLSRLMGDVHTNKFLQGQGHIGVLTTNAEKGAHAVLFHQGGHALDTQENAQRLDSLSPTERQALLHLGKSQTSTLSSDPREASSRDPHVARTLDYLENLYADSPREHGFQVDAGGNVVDHTQGHREGVSPTAIHRQTIFTHNHPLGSPAHVLGEHEGGKNVAEGLSRDDVMLLAHHQRPEVRAVEASPDGSSYRTYSIQRGKNPVHIETLDPFLQENHQRGINHLSTLSSREEGNHFLQHDMMHRVVGQTADQAGLLYSRRTPKRRW